MTAGTELYCWGNTSHGQLGLGGIEDEQVWSEGLNKNYKGIRFNSLFS